MATIIGKPGNDTLTGTNNNDVINGNGGIDYIDAKGGNDTITGAGTIIGGKGNDYINLTDDSTVIFNLGDGIDTINNIYLAQSTTIVFGNTIKTNMVTMQQFGFDLIIRIGNNDDQIIVKDYFSNNDYKNLPYRLKFADGTVWISNGINPINTNKIVDHIPQTVGTIAPTQILKNNEWNFTTNNYFTDKDTGDKLTYSATLADGSALPSWLTFDADTGKFSGTPPNTTGKPIDYTIIITATDKYNESASQTLKLTVSPFSFINNGTTGNDTITGTADDDSIQGGYGDDSIIAGAGNDLIYGDTNKIDPKNKGNNYIDAGAGKNTVYGGIGNDEIIAGNEDNLIYGDLENSNKYYGDDSIMVGDGKNVIYGGGGNDTIIAGNGNNTIYGDFNNNKINLGDNQIQVGDGNNTIYGGAGNDTIIAGNGNNQIIDNYGQNIITTSNGNDTITGTGTITAGKGNDSITINVAGSQDTIIFNIGDGKDIINSLDTSKNKAVDTIKFGTGITKSDISFSTSGKDLIVLVGSTGDQITLKNFFAGENYQTLRRFEFADGTTWEDVRTEVTFTLTGTDGNDKITGTPWNDIIHGGLGNDVITDISGNNELYGDEGNDNITGRGTLIGGTGNDTLTANVAGSSDTFIFDKGDGTDIINSIDAAKVGEKGSDIIEFGNNITTDMVNYEIKGNNLVITIGSDDQITINNYFKGANYQTIEKFTFKDGSIWELNPNGTNGFEITKNPPPSGGDAIGFSAISEASIENQTNGLIDAMAGFAPSSSAHTLLEDKPLDTNNVLIATNIN